MLTAEEQIKLDIVMKVLEGKLTREQARQLLQVSKSTLKRYIRRFRARGAAFVKHGNTHRAPANKNPSRKRVLIEQLIREKYYDLNMTHLHEKLIEEEHLTIGRESLRKICHELHMVKRAKRRRVRARLYRDRMPQRGLMLQLDGSHHAWFGQKKSVLIAAIDDATNEIPYAEFFTSEDTFNCMKVIQKIIETYGIFQVLYTDRAGIFGGGKRQNFAQLKRACEELGIQVIYAYSPQAKGRIERLFQTLQDRLIVEMRIRQIQTFEEANQFLQTEFLPILYSDRFTRPPENPESAYQPLQPWIDLRQIFCLKEFRRIQNDHTISYENHFYALKPRDGISISRHELEIREYPNHPWKAFYRGHEVPLRKI